jgi:hypothetical protein
VFAHALGEKRETVSYKHNYGNINVVAGIDGTDAFDRLEVVPLDDDIPPGLRIDFLKLDVEGYELAVLKGAAAALRQRPFIDLEIHNFLFIDRVAMLDAIFTILSGSKYSFEVLPEVMGEILDVGTTVNTAWLAGFENPHVFCTPL